MKKDNRHPTPPPLPANSLCIYWLTSLRLSKWFWWGTELWQISILSKYECSGPNKNSKTWIPCDSWCSHRSDNVGSESYSSKNFGSGPISIAVLKTNQCEPLTIHIDRASQHEGVGIAPISMSSHFTSAPVPLNSLSLMHRLPVRERQGGAEVKDGRRHLNAPGWTRNTSWSLPGLRPRPP